MEKDFKYISDSHIIFVFLLCVGVPVPLTASAFLDEPGAVFWVLMVWVIWLLMGVLSVCTSHLTGHFKADEKECSFRFFKGNLHFRYEDIKDISFFNIPRHTRWGDLAGYKIQLRITDKKENEHIIQQNISAEYSSYDYPQQFPEEVRNAELTQIGNFLKLMLRREKLLLSYAPESPQKSEEMAVSPEIADSEIKTIQERMAEKAYIKDIQIHKIYDFINHKYKTNLLLTLTNDDTFYTDDDCIICFENISSLNLQDMEAIVRTRFMIYDYLDRGHEAQNRFALFEEENDILSFSFEKAEISS